LAIRRDLRPDRLLPGGVSERHRLEPAQHVDRLLAPARPPAPTRRPGVSPTGGMSGGATTWTAAAGVTTIRPAFAASRGGDMSRASGEVSRRAFLGMLGAAAALPSGFAHAAAGPMLTRAIPATGEEVPAIGMGTWITFNVGGDEALRAERAEVVRTFFERGGAVIDSSPMYGTSEAVIGHCLAHIGHEGPLFAATKVWTPLKWFGPGQMEQSRELWGVERFDLMQIHN